MKTFKWMSALLITALLTIGQNAGAEEKTKEFKQSWPVSEVSTLQVINKFGEVKVNNDGGSEVTVHVKVTVEGANEKRTEELLNMIDVNFEKNGSTVRAETKIGNDFKSQKRFSIDYTINIPSNKNLEIENKYGNTVVNELTANGRFEIKYGNLTANKLLTSDGGKLSVDLAYGNGSIGEASNLVAQVAYSPMTIDEANTLKLESKYASLDLGKAKEVTIDSKYDKLNIDEVGSLTAVTKYSNLKVGQLKKSLKIESGYGGVKVEEVSKDFEFIEITNSYGQILLGMDDAAYAIDASCEYCGISYPSNEFQGNRIKENNKSTIEGNVGSGGKGRVFVRSRYGEIKLN